MEPTIMTIMHIYGCGYNGKETCPIYTCNIHCRWSYLSDNNGLA